MSRDLPWLTDFLERYAAEGLLRRRRQTRWLPDGWCEVDGRRVSNFISNDYLNLASDPRVVAAAELALWEYGVGARASALLGGRSDWHVRLEERLAEFEGESAAILFPTGMAANLGTVAALVGADDAVFSDRLNHASLIDGCRLSKARVQIYRHDELETLDRILGQARDRPRRWIISDSVFSMDGDLAPLPELCNLADRHRAELIVDEAHGTGVWGNSGRGVAEHFGVENRIAVRIGTLSKGLGTQGGFVAGPQPLIDYLWNKARTQFFSTAFPPALCAAAVEAVAIVRQEPERRLRLHHLSAFLRQQLEARGVPVLAGSLGPIVPIVLQDPARAMSVAGRLEDRGFLVGAIRPPTVPAGTSRLRISVSTAHAVERLNDLATAVAEELRRT